MPVLSLGRGPHFRGVRGRLPLPSFLFFYFFISSCCMFPLFMCFEYVVSVMGFPIAYVNQLIICHFGCFSPKP